MNKAKLKKILLENASPEEKDIFLLKERMGKLENLPPKEVIRETLIKPEIKEVAKYESGEKIVEKINELESKPEKQIGFAHIKDFPWSEVKRLGGEGLIAWGDGGFNLKEVTLAQITANQNDYELGIGSMFRLSSDASRTITGLQGGTAGEGIVLINVGSFDIVLANQSASSGSINRIITGTGANLTIGTGESAMLFYDNTTERWRVQSVSANVGVDGSGTANEIAYWVDADTLGALAVATYPSLTELSYVKGVTSGIQAQIDAKFTLPSLTSGSVLFSNGITIAQDNANFFWDDTNNRLGIGFSTPTNKLDVNGSLALATSGFIGFVGNVAVTTANYSLFGNTTLTLLNARSGGSIGFRIANIDVANFSTTGGFGFGATFYNIDAGQNNMIIEGNLGVGVSAPTAYLHLKTGTTAASTAPLKFNSGSLNTIAEVGAVEFLTDDFYGTITTGAARKKFVLDNGTNLTSGRVPFATTNGRLTDDSDLTFSVDTLSATKVAMSSLTSGRVPFASTAGLLVDDADFTFATDTLTVAKLTVSGGTITLTVDTNFVLSGGVNGVTFATDALTVDGTNKRVGVGTASPTETLTMLAVNTSVNQFGIGVVGETTRAGLYHIDALGLYFYSNLVNGTDQPFAWYTDSTTERMRLTEVGNLKLAGTATRATTEGTNHLDIFDGTAPAGTLANGVSLYSTAGELRVMDAAGNPTLLSPHNKQGEWIMDTYIMKGTEKKRIVVDMQKMIYAINEKFGWDFIHEFEIE